MFPVLQMLADETEVAEEVIEATIQRDSIITFPMFGDGFAINPPAYFTIFGRNIYFYGVIIAVGFILAIFWMSRNAKRFGLKEDDIYDVFIWVIPFAILGARLYFVAFNLDYYLANPSEILAVWEGGLAIYGGVIAGIIVIYFVCRHKKVPFLAMMDIVVCGLIMGQAVGRWGNFMNREAFGGITDVFCRMGLTDVTGKTIYVHPTFLYESLWNAVGFCFLVWWTKKGHRKYDGQNTLIYFFWYGLGRAWIEGLRTDSLYIGNTGIRVSQALSVVLCAAAFAALLAMHFKKTPVRPLYADTQKAAAEAQDAPAGTAEAAGSAREAPAGAPDAGPASESAEQSDREE